METLSFLASCFIVLVSISVLGIAYILFTAKLRLFFLHLKLKQETARAFRLKKTYKNAYQYSEIIIEKNAYLIARKDFTDTGTALQYYKAKHCKINRFISKF